MFAASGLLGGSLDQVTVGDAVLILGVLAGAVAVVRKAWPWVRRFVAFINAIVGEPEGSVLPGQERRLGVLDRLAGVEDVAGTAASHAERAADEAAATREAAERAAVAAERAAEAAGEAVKQLHPNGGSSARDRLDQIATAVGAAEPSPGEVG